MFFTQTQSAGKQL